VSLSSAAGSFEAWIAFVRPNPAARLRLFCLPHAGGGAVLYRAWPDAMPPEVEVCPVQLPGRGTRLRERPLESMGPLVQELARALRPLLDRPFAVFGHSMGALVGFEWARELRRQGAPLPCHLFMAGRRAPQLADPEPRVHDAPESALVDHVRRLGATPREVLEDPDLMRLLLPALRADLAVCETYAYEDEPPLSCPISALLGREDGHAPPADAEAWRAQTAGPFRMETFPGGHFFVQDRALREAVGRELRAYGTTRRIGQKGGVD
jgi:medium-chain acyl-[acyl-carrier-protein] hydrolase